MYFTKKDTETSAGNSYTLYGEEDKLVPKQHLSHPTQPTCSATEKMLNQNNDSHSKEREELQKIRKTYSTSQREIKK